MSVNKRNELCAGRSESAPAFLQLGRLQASRPEAGTRGRTADGTAERHAASAAAPKPSANAHVFDAAGGRRRATRAAGRAGDRSYAPATGARASAT